MSPEVTKVLEAASTGKKLFRFSTEALQAALVRLASATSWDAEIAAIKAEIARRAEAARKA